MSVLDGRLFGEEQPCFGCAIDHPIGFRLRFEREGDTIHTRFVPGEQYQGPPGIMHGGLVMTLADEVAAWTIIGLKNRFGFTVEAKLKLKNAVRTGEEVLARGQIAKDGSRIVEVLVEVLQGEKICTSGTMKFALLDQERAEELLQRPLPEAWKTFSRER